MLVKWCRIKCRMITVRQHEFVKAFTHLNDPHLKLKLVFRWMAAGRLKLSERTVEVLHRSLRKMSLSLGETCRSLERRFKQTGIDQRQTGRVYWLIDGSAVCDLCFRFILSFTQGAGRLYNRSHSWMTFEEQRLANALWIYSWIMKSIIWSYSRYDKKLKDVVVKENTKAPN